MPIFILGSCAACGVRSTAGATDASSAIRNHVTCGAPWLQLGVEGAMPELPYADDAARFRALCAALDAAPSGLALDGEGAGGA